MDAVAVLPPGGGLIGAACAALGLSRASFHRRTATARRPPAPFSSAPSSRQGAGRFPSVRPSSICCANPGSSTNPRRKSTPSCSTRASIIARSGPCTASSTRTARCSERRHQLRHPVYKKPELIADGPNQVWSWDITKLMGPAKWTYFYLYVIIDIFSRTSSAGSSPTPKAPPCSSR